MKKIIGVLAGIVMTAALFAASSPIRKMGKTTSVSETLDNGKSKYVSIFAINDFHGTVEEDLTGKNLGMAKLAQVISELQAANPESIFVSAGDNYQGSSLSNLSQGKIVSDFFKYMNLAASTIGNHEFDWGSERFAEWERDGGFSFLACNLIEKQSGKLPSWCKEYELFNVGGHTICVIGVATIDTIFTTKKDLIEGYDFLDPAKTVRKVLRKVQATYHPEAVVVLSHIGSHINRLSGTPVSAANDPKDKFELEDLCKIKGIDAVITGHSHELVNAKLNGKPVVQAMNYGRAVSQIRIKFNEKGVSKVEGRVIQAHKDRAEITENKDMLALLGKYKSEYGNQLGEKIAFVESELSHEETVPNVTPLGFVVTTAMKAAFNADFAVTNGGGLRKSIKAGTLTVNDMWELIPFDNTGVLVTVKGKDLKRIVDHGINSVGFRAGQFAGGKVYYSTKMPEGSRVTKIVLDDGREVQDDESYKVVVNDFMAMGGDKYDCIPESALEINNTYIPFRDAVIEQLKSWGTIKKEWSGIPNVLIAE